MKKTSAIIMISIFLLGICGSIIPNFSGQELQYINEPLVEDCNCGGISDQDTTHFGDDYRVMSNPIDCTQLTITQHTTPILDTPDEFNWKDIDGVDWTTIAKHQGNCGSCWDFAALGALESRIKIMEECSQLQPDLSEQYALSCLPAAANNYGQGCLGGTPYKHYYYIQDEGEEGNNVNGIIPEWCFPYQASHNIPCDEKCDDWMEHLIPLTDCDETFLDLGYATEENTNIIKSIIYEYGPIAVALNVTQNFINYWGIHHSPNDYYPDTHEPWGNRLNHIVVLVGWKDDPQIDNGGYWIVKNSWGTDWGYDGFFNIEYYSLFIGMYYATATYDPDSVNWAPVADAGGLYYTELDDLITFDGTNSVDSEGDVDTYEWDFGDDTIGEGPTPTHTYTEEGIYAVTLNVTDTQGCTGTDTALVGIGEEPLIIDVTGIFGINLMIQNPLDIALTNLKWNVDISGLILTGDTDGIIPILVNDEPFTKQILVIGLGLVTVSINVENMEKTETFLIIGPLVFGLKLQ